MQMSIIMSNMLMSNVAYMWFWRQVGGRLQWQQLALFLTTSSMSKASASESSKCEQPIINHVSFKWRTITDKFLTRSTAYSRLFNQFCSRTFKHLYKSTYQLNVECWKIGSTWQNWTSCRVYFKNFFGLHNTPLSSPPLPSPLLPSPPFPSCPLPSP